MTRQNLINCRLLLARVRTIVRSRGLCISRMKWRPIKSNKQNVHIIFHFLTAAVSIVLINQIDDIRHAVAYEE